MHESPIQELSFALVYASDRTRSMAFYEKFFSFKVDATKKMEGDQVFGYIGPVGLWIGGGYTTFDHSEKATRATVMLQVKSASTLFFRLKNEGVKLYQDKPIPMSPQTYWFQCADPDGNILDFLGKQ